MAERVTAEATEGTTDAGLARAGRTIRHYALLNGGACWAAATLTYVLVSCVADNVLRLPGGLRLPLAVGGLAIAVGLFVKRVWRPSRPRRAESVALALERQYQVPENLLINAFQLSKSRRTEAEDVFVRRTTVQSSQVLSGLDLRDIRQTERLRRWGLGAGIAAVLWAVYAIGFPGYAGNACARLSLPLADIPPIGAFELSVTPSSSITVGEGESLDVCVTVRSRAGKPVPAPSVVWKEEARTVEAADRGCPVARMLPVEGHEGQYRFIFASVGKPFAFRVLAGDSATPAVPVSMLALPRIEAGFFRVRPPDYIGGDPILQPGPPATLAALPGSEVDVQVQLRPAGIRLSWASGAERVPFTRVDAEYTVSIAATAACPYVVEGQDKRGGRRVAIARGQVTLQSDNPPRVDLGDADLNRFVLPGESIPLEIEAVDDHGVREVQVAVRVSDLAGIPRVLKSWTYLGPPGRGGAVREKFVLVADPREFEPGRTYVVEALAADFSPGKEWGRSKPMILRIRGVADLAPPPGDALTMAMQALRQTIEAQLRANGLTENLEANLDEAVAKASVDQHRRSMVDQQSKARELGMRAVAEFRRVDEGKTTAIRLAPLVEDEMRWVLGDLGRVGPGKVAELRPRFPPIRERQAHILAELTALLGRSVGAAKDRASEDRPVAGAELPSGVTAADLGTELKEDMEKFVAVQRRILERSKTLMDQGPEDLTAEEEQILGELAREEARWATFMEEKLTDFSKLPIQDFADGSIADEFNETFMEIKEAAKALYDKKVELAVPHEQGGLENAEELIHNLERWLMDHPDNIKWNMEEPPVAADIALAELPSELEDIVGALLDKEEEMDDDVEDVTSSWLDSIDKGAGWDAGDGPISSMSAKGVTGNLLPNKQEVGGRSGEGRTGQSHGQMVEATAQGKGGRETPTRVTPSPFEQGSVEDSSKESPGGATGGGKLAGFAEEGLRGPTVPPPLRQKMARLAGQQARIRQQAEALSLKLRAYHLPSGDLENSTVRMREVEAEAARGYGPGVRQAFTRVVDSLSEAQRAVHAEAALRREETRLPEGMRDEIMTGLQDGVPRGYEEMTSEYFKSIARESP